MKVKISGIEGLEGEYDVLIHGDNTRYTTAEWRGIKRHTDLMPMDFETHGEKLDPDVFAAALWVTLTREGKDPKFVWAALDNSDLFDGDKFASVDAPEEDEDSPPEEAPTSTDDGNETETEDESEPSGETSPKPLALLENHPSLTGHPRSATGAA